MLATLVGAALVLMFVLGFWLAKNLPEAEAQGLVKRGQGR